VIRHETHVRVRYAETDQMKAAYYGRYFEYFEQARSDMLRAVGLPYPRLEEMGLWLPVIEAHAEYRRWARYEGEAGGKGADRLRSVRAGKRGAHCDRLHHPWIRKRDNGEAHARSRAVP
jgi:hypothetical protein